MIGAINKNHFFLQIHMGCMHGVDADGKTPAEQHVCHICGNSYGHKLRFKPTCQIWSHCYLLDTSVATIGTSGHTAPSIYHVAVIATSSHTAPSLYLRSYDYYI